MEIQKTLPNYNLDSQAEFTVERCQVPYNHPIDEDIVSRLAYWYDISIYEINKILNKAEELLSCWCKADEDQFNERCEDESSGIQYRCNWTILDDIVDIESDKSPSQVAIEAHRAQTGRYIKGDDLWMRDCEPFVTLSPKQVITNQVITSPNDELGLCQ